MRVALFSDTYLPDLNGVATSTKTLHDALVRNNHEVIVITSELPSDSDYQDDFKDNIVRVPGLEMSLLYGYRACNIFSYSGMREIRDFQPDIVHVQTEFGLGIFGRLVAQELDLPVVYTYHTMYIDYSHYVNPINNEVLDEFLKNIISRLSNLYANKCSQLIVPSKKTADSLKRYGLKREPRIVPTGLELERFNPKNRNVELENGLIEKYNLKDKFVMVFLGRLAKEKSIESILDMVVKLKNVRNDFALLIVGGGNYLTDLKDMVEKEHISEHVIFTGPQFGELVPAHYHISDVFISASLSETQGLTYIEAMASGIPALARYDENLEGVIKDGINGYFFHETDELLKIVLRLMDSNIETLKSSALEDSARFSSQKFYEDIIAVYNEAVVSKRYNYEIVAINSSKQNYFDVDFKVDQTVITLELAAKFIDEYDISVGKVINRELFNALKNLEQITIAYNKALKWLAFKDYPEAQIREKLDDAGFFTDEQIDTTINFLKERDLVNDERYACDYIETCTRKSIGINRAIYSLRKSKVRLDAIDFAIENLDQQNQIESAKSMIEDIYATDSTKSYRSLVNAIRNRLFNRGFTPETIDIAMGSINLRFDIVKEKETLEKELVKCQRKYQRKYQGDELIQRCIDGLLKKGYRYEDIKEIVERGEVFDD
ncbi:MAG: RecX family transcriptional regulator [Erysipelotrichaceae bacterium]|nr:RecX family transcriptional regulator [Erysipelotrichaceae bacterium]MDD3808659.1 RecX family transcriptional regulator [Erysipelotrichaceae bacterium]